MDLTRKYIELTCEICGKTYFQQERLFKKALWKNRCHSHRGIKFNKYEGGMNYEKSKKCPDCGKVICRASTKCKSCSHKKRTQKYCIDCGIKITHYAEQRCRKCHNKKLDRGLSKERTKFNNSILWKSVRKRCFERDNYTCQICNTRGSYIEAHHLSSYKKHPLLRLELSNVITLCRKCHLKLHHNKEFKHKYYKYAS